MRETKLNLDDISPKIIGQKVLLGPFRSELADTYRRWLHDLETSVNLHPNILLTFEDEQEWLRSFAKQGNIGFTIYEKKTGTPIGSTGLHFNEGVNYTAEFGILIGEKSFQEKGLGTEATALTVDYGFNILNLSSISLKVHEFNKRGFHVYEKVGFRTVGIRRNSFYLAGKFYNDILMDILPQDLNSGFFKNFVHNITQENTK